MSYVIWKQELAPGLREYQMPKDAKVLHVAFQRGAATLWFLCNPSAPKEARRFLLTGTGHSIENADRLEFVGTLLTEDQRFVFHVFEELDEIRALVRGIL